MVAVINMPFHDTSSGDTYYQNYSLGSLQTISYSTHLERKPIRKVGNVNAVDYVMGPRTIAGSLIFTVYDKHFADRIMKDAINKYGINTNIIVDDLPPFDIIINFANEYGSKSKLTISGVRLINEGQVMSINDIYVENTYQFVATDLIYMDKDTSKIEAGGRTITAGKAPAIKGGEKDRISGPAPSIRGGEPVRTIIPPPRLEPGEKTPIVPAVVPIESGERDKDSTKITDIEPGGTVIKDITYPTLQGSKPIILDEKISYVPKSNYSFNDGVQFKQDDSDIEGQMIEFVRIIAERFKEDKGTFPIKVSFSPERDTGVLKVLDSDKNEINKISVKSFETIISLKEGTYYLKYEDENTFSDLVFIHLQSEVRTQRRSNNLIVNNTFKNSAIVENIPEDASVYDESGNAANHIRILRSNNKIENMKVKETYFLRNNHINFKISSENGPYEDYLKLLELIDNSSISNSDKEKERTLAEKAYSIVKDKEIEMCEGMFSLNSVFEKEYIDNKNQENEYNMKTTAKLTGILCTIFKNRISSINVDVFTPEIIDQTGGIIGLNYNIEQLRLQNIINSRDVNIVTKSNFSSSRGNVSYVLNDIKTKMYKVSAFESGQKITPYIFVYKVDIDLYKEIKEEKVYSVSVNNSMYREIENVDKVKIREVFQDIVYYNRNLFNLPIAYVEEDYIEVEVNSPALNEKNSSYLVCIIPKEKFGMKEFVSRKRITLFNNTTVFNERDIGVYEDYLCWVEDIYGNEVSRCLYIDRDSDENYNFKVKRKHNLAKEINRVLSENANYSEYKYLIEQVIDNSNINEGNLFNTILNSIMNTHYSRDKKLKMFQDFFSIRSLLLSKVGHLRIMDELSVEEDKLELNEDLNWTLYVADLLNKTVSQMDVNKEILLNNDKRYFYAIYCYNNLFYSTSKAFTFSHNDLNTARII